MQKQHDPIILPPKYGPRKVIQNIKPTKNNYGWWLLAILLLFCLVGFLYQYLANTLSWDIKLFNSGRSFYLEPLMFTINFVLISIFNPILSLITDGISIIIRVINPTFSGFVFQFAPIFVAGDKWFTILRSIASGAIVTLQISLVSIAIGFVIAVVLAVILVRPGRVWGLKPFSQAYVDFFRSTPLLVQLFLIYFGVPSLLQNSGIPGFETFTFTVIEAAIIGLSLNTAAYQAEIIRGGILAIPTGQTEAARALGLTNLQTMRFVILPQALRIIIPPFTNEGINIILNSSLASVIATPEIMRMAKNESAYFYEPFGVYVLAALFYFVMAFSLAKLAKKLEIRVRIPGLGVHHD
ncbi:MAG: amino acid ABC transporter permease [Candidatus Heimdallarchaeota archaeon]|nr:amino acid ABC transporter permease [Candidatus Heimdallarchaeota archaeon]